MDPFSPTPGPIQYTVYDSWSLLVHPKEKPFLSRTFSGVWTITERWCWCRSEAPRTWVHVWSCSRPGSGGAGGVGWRRARRCAAFGGGLRCRHDAAPSGDTRAAPSPACQRCSFPVILTESGDLNLVLCNSTVGLLQADATVPSPNSFLTKGPPFSASSGQFSLASTMFHSMGP